jgi:class 3 adenylate cyclase/tetratricopeptide (TPR) repeat protein
MTDLRTQKRAGSAGERRARVAAGDATELRNVTVLFADVFRSTEAVLRLDPDQARDYLDGPVEIMLAGVRKFGGAIGNIQGDGVMAVFGASAATEDHALRACLAAMEIRDAFAAAAPFPGVPPTQLRLGVHSGGASTRRKNGGLTEEFDAIGAVVHVASKIERLCPPGSVCVSTATLRLVRGYVRAAPMAPLPLGDGEPALEIEELLEVSPDYRLEHYFRARRPSPLVGRAIELQALGQALQPTSPQPAIVGLVGEAGMGKSRLCYEAQSLAERAGYRIAEIRGASLNSATPFAPLAACLEPFLLMDAAQRNEQLTAQLRELDLTPLEVEAVASVFGATDPGGVWESLSGGARNKAIVDGIAKTLRGLAQRRPLLLIVEDLHDVDHETRACLRRAAQLAAGCQCCIVATARPEGAEALAEICPQVFRLEALSREQSRQLVQNELNAGSAADIRPDLVEDVLERGNGNPFVLEELLRGMGAPNSRGIGGVPMSIEILIRSRVDKLPADARRLLHLASVLGMRFPALSLRGIAGADSRSFERGLRELVRDRFVVADSGLQVEFVHQITRVACYEGIPRGQRAKLHEAVLDAAEHDRRRLALSFEALADHAYRAGQLDRALTYLWEACRESIASSAVRSVAELRRRALAICAELGEAAALREVDFELLCFDAMQQLGAYLELAEPLDRALKVAEIVGSPRRVCQASGHLATTHWVLGHYDRAYAFATQALSTALEAGDLPLASYAQFVLGCIQFKRGRPDEAVRLERDLSHKLTGKLERARFGAVAVMGVMSRAFLCWFLTDLGQFEEAGEAAAAALSIANAMEQPYSQLLSHDAEGYRLYRLERYEEASAVLEKAYEICQSGAFLALDQTVSGWFAGALIRSGREDEARTIVRRALDLDLGKYCCVPGSFYVYDAHAQLLARDGEVEAALEAADRAVRFVWETRDPLHYAYAVFARAEVKAAVGAGREAVLHDCRWALRRAVKLGMRPLEAECRRVLHELG